MRLFVAIPFSGKMKNTLNALMQDLKRQGVGGNYTDVKNLHLTLCFIGETDDAEKITEALSRLRYRPFRLSTAELGTFGDLLWLGVKSSPALKTLAAEVRQALTEAGVSFDRKKFRPHITLVRRMRGTFSEKVNFAGEMTVSRVSLMQSQRIGGKLIYTEVFSF